MENHVKKLKELLKKNQICMVGSVSPDAMHFQPLPLAQVDEMGNLWFFTTRYSVQAEEVKEESARVQVTYSDRQAQVYVSVTGVAVIGHENRGKMEELFQSFVKEWLPKGLNDPRLAIMKVRPVEIDYWTASSGRALMGVKLLENVIAAGK